MAKKEKSPKGNSSKGLDNNEAEVTAKEIIPVEIEEQMKKSYLAYAMSVIVGRALPDVRDGLKPVHRRILHAMNERAWRSDRPYVKSAKIVGEVIGNFHPHGDSAVYDTMVRMAQDFSMRVPLIDGQGNFGSVDGDSAAAYRYTEARLASIAEQLLMDIDKETVDFVPNFDDTRKEPLVLPSAWPNLLVNGSQGIAVGMTTKIPPHNLAEVISALELLIEKSDCSIKELMRRMPAPDFPTGGIILGKEGLKKAYQKGRGSIRLRAVTDIEEMPRGKTAIIVNEIPYEVKKDELISQIASMVNSKKIEGIGDIRDESDREGMRIVFELRKDTNVDIVLNQLFKYTRLQISYGIIMLALVDNQPRLLNLKEILGHYLNHRKEVVRRRTEYLLKKALEREHILEGLKIALDFIDEVIRIIRASQTVEIARHSLMERFKLSEIQANAILEMRLQKLTSLESSKIIEELEQVRASIKEYRRILSSEKNIFAVISEELSELKAKSTKRKSEISQAEGDDLDIDKESLIHDEDQVISISESGYIRRVGLDTFKRQNRGGRGITSGGKKEDALKLVHYCRSLDIVMLFSNRGKVFYTKAYDIPESSKNARGSSIKALVVLAGDEYITAIRSVRNFEDDQYLFLLTRQGIVKKMAISQISNAKKRGILAVSFKDNSDWLVDVAVVGNKQDVFLASRQGQGLRTGTSRMRAQGRSAGGIIGMSLNNDDSMAGVGVVTDDKEEFLLLITEKGYGKCVKYSEFAVKGRGGKGMTYAKLSDKQGEVVAIRSAREDSETVISTISGMTIRVAVKDISLQGRTSGGVRVVDIGNDDAVAAMTVLHLES